MIRFLGLVAAVALLPAAVAAQTVVVRSGEHAGFSRIVLQLPRGAVWSLDKDARSASLRVDRPALRFDTSKVFERIPRTRLAEIGQAAPGDPLIFALGCDCRIEDFLQSDQFLVIDIADPKADAVPAPEDVDAAASADPVVLPVVPELPLAGLNAPLPAVRNAQEAGNEMARVAVSDSPVPAALNRFENRLLEQLDRAMDQGILQPRRRAGTKAVAGGAADPPGPDGGAAPEPAAIGLSISNVIDEGIARDAGGRFSVGSEAVCLPDALFAVNEWGSEAPFAAQVGRLRSALFGEFDRVNLDAVDALARLYLYFGFGAEASDTLALAREDSQEIRAMTAIAAIMDGVDAPPANPLSGQQGCEGDVALWSVLATGNATGPFNSDAILLGFARLPAHLKSYLGPVLVRRLGDAGETDMASAVLTATRRSGDADDPALLFAEASLAHARGNVERWADGMSEVIASGSEHAPRALIEHVEAKWQSRGAIAPDLPVLLDAYALENRDAEIGPDLRRAQVLALSLAGDFSQASDRLAEIARVDGPARRDLAAIPFLTLLLERGSDLDFLRDGTGPFAGHDLQIPDALATAAARRLLDLGFPDLALGLLQAPGGAETADERRLLRARAALSQDLPNRALVELMSLAGSDADLLRAEAMTRNGNHAQAAEIFRMAGAQEEAARGLWISQADDLTPELEGTRYGQIAKYAADLVAPPGEGDPDMPPLQAARSLIANSANARGRIADMLALSAVD